MRRLIPLIALVLMLSVAAPTLASLPDKAEEIITHLEFLGYETKADDNAVIATHPEKLNIVVREFAGGILIVSYFGTTDYAKANTNELLVHVNKLNMEAAAARFYIDQDGDLAIEGYFPGSYSKQSFGIFLDTFNKASAQLGDMLPALEKFFN